MPACTCSVGMLKASLKTYSLKATGLTSWCADPNKGIYVSSFTHLAYAPTDPGKPKPSQRCLPAGDSACMHLCGQHFKGIHCPMPRAPDHAVQNGMVPGPLWVAAHVRNSRADLGESALGCLFAARPLATGWVGGWGHAPHRRHVLVLLVVAHHKRRL